MGCHNTVTGRVLSVDHDHIDVESYSHESDGQIHIRRILVPLHLILHIDITSAEIAEEEDSTLATEQREGKAQASDGPIIDLPDAPQRLRSPSSFSAQSLIFKSFFQNGYRSRWSLLRLRWQRLVHR